MGFAQEHMDLFAGIFLDRLQNRILDSLPFNHVDLDKTSLWKRQASPRFVASKTGSLFATFSFPFPRRIRPPATGPSLNLQIKASTRLWSQIRTTGLHIFTRDLRLEDNRALRKLATEVDVIIPVFVFTPEQTLYNDYFSYRSFAFLLAALGDLAARGCPLSFFFGRHPDVIAELLDAVPNVKAISIAEDYTPYAKEREQNIERVSKAKGVKFLCTEDHHLTPGGLHGIRSSTGSIYRVFTPFRNACLKTKESSDGMCGATDADVFKKVLSFANFTNVSLCTSYSLELATRKLLSPKLGVSSNHDNVAAALVQFYRTGKVAKPALDAISFTPHPGSVLATRAAAVAQARTYDYEGSYRRCRDRIDTDGTLLAPHLKFGLVSAREVRKILLESVNCTAQVKDLFVSELFWRDFYQYVTLHTPHVLRGMQNASAQSSGHGAETLQNENFSPKFAVQDIDWKQDDKAFKRWQDGQTGVPLVDACMRELKRTGVMHNRGRMVVAMFLTKNLLQDWRRGEKYFAQNLVDYDPMSNNGGWQWSSSTGADGAPYFRVMNPQSQLAKVDPEGAYVRKWVDEVRTIPKRALDKWDEQQVRDKYIDHQSLNMQSPANTNYYAPMVDLKRTRQAAIEAFKAAGNKARMLS